MKSPKDQRLIFSGKLLDDSMVLNQVFIKVCFFSSLALSRMRHSICFIVRTFSANFGFIVYDSSCSQFGQTYDCKFLIEIFLRGRFSSNIQTPKTPQSTTERPRSPIPEQIPPSIIPTSTSTHSSTYEQYLEELNKYQEQLQQYV